MKILVIDSGTTTSRIRLWDGEKVVISVSKKTGAKDVSINGNNVFLKNAIKDCIDEILIGQGITIDDIDAIIACGMITSNVGLIEIPHIPSPVGLSDLSMNMVEKSFSEIAKKPILFIRGVKTGFEDGKDIIEKDIMRGEEAELFGYLCTSIDYLQEGTLFMHYGSHHKCILVENGKIMQSRTSITGELMTSIMQNTILSSNLLPIDEIKVDMDWVRKGLDAAEKSGFGRALFSVRILNAVDKKDKMEASSFYLGTLLSLDLDMVKNMINHHTNKIVLYGRKLFPSAFEQILKERYPSLGVTIVSEEESDYLSVKGAVKIYESSAYYKKYNK